MCTFRSQFFTAETGYKRSATRQCVRFAFVFFIFVNNLLDSIVSLKCFMFADDSKLLSLIFAASFIQHNIDLFLKWAEQNSLKVHSGKSQVIVFSGQVTNVFLNSGKKFSVATEVKDLGAYFDRQLNRKFHIDFRLCGINTKFYHINEMYLFVYE